MTKMMVPIPDQTLIGKMLEILLPLYKITNIQGEECVDNRKPIIFLHRIKIYIIFKYKKVLHIS